MNALYMVYWCGMVLCLKLGSEMSGSRGSMMYAVSVCMYVCTVLIDAICEENVRVPLADVGVL